MKILIITPFYTPDIGPSAPLFTLLSEALVKHGHHVCVVAAVPHYPSGKVSPAFRGLKIRHSMENGVEVIRVPVPSLDRANLKNRIFQLISYQIGSTIASLFYRYDVALITNPALETWLPTIWHAVVRHKPMIYSVFDVYPDVGMKLGIFRSKWIINVVKWLECSCLKPAASVQIISDNFRASLKALRVPDSKLVYIPIWVDSDLIRPLPQNNQFYQEHHLNDKFVVLYAGNIGLSQDLECILSAAELLEEHADIQVVFVGDGMGKESLKAEAEKRRLSNVQFIAFQPRERLPEVLASANVTVILLRHGIGLDSLPSKTFSSMASGRPIIASVDEESDLHKLVMESKSGICIPAENSKELADTIIVLKNDVELCRNFGVNGRQYIEFHHAVSVAEGQFEQLFTSVIASRKTKKALQT